MMHNQRQSDGIRYGLHTRSERHIGFKQIRTSDISGEIIVDAELLTVTVRNEGKVFDCRASELAGLKEMTGLVELEVRAADNTTRRLVVTAKDFYAVVPKEIVDNADSTRGRRSGYRPGSGS